MNAVERVAANDRARAERDRLATRLRTSHLALSLEYAQHIDTWEDTWPDYLAWLENEYDRCAAITHPTADTLLRRLTLRIERDRLLP